MLRRGSLVPLIMEKDVVCYGRLRGRERAIVTVYTGTEARDLEIPVWKLGLCSGDRLQRVIQTFDTNYNVGVLDRVITDGVLKLHLLPVSAGLILGEISEKNEFPSLRSR